jgi:multicomponent Na+:H+ antiporter subunit B
MNSIILRTATQFLLPLMILFSIFLFIRGHNEPGGGFVGGLMAAGALALYAIVFRTDAAGKALRIRPQSLIGAGLATSLISGLYAMIFEQPFFTGIWTKVSVPELGEQHLGTPLLFDFGVYLVVIGATLTVIFSLMEE